MNIYNIIKVAFRSLRKNKMRTFLTMLGIIIGVAAVIAMISIGQGANASVQENIRKMGSNLLIVFPGSFHRGGVRGGMGTVISLKEDDVKALLEESKSISMASPTVRTGAQVVYGNMNWATGVEGVYPDFFYIREWPLVSGRSFTMQDVHGQTKVCVIGKTVYEKLFGNEDPIGKIIRIKKLPFTVIGALASKGQSGGWRDQDDVIFAPLYTVQRKMMGITNINTIHLSVISKDMMNDAKEEIRQVLRKRHKLLPSQDDDFTIMSQTEISEAAESTTRIMTILLGSIASISLLVGGIGIMNIMLVSVTERTREIGIRMAVGAKERDILVQFLIESVVLSLIGGIIGMIVGIFSSEMISYFAKWPTLISSQAILLAFLFSSGVGIFFGFYPAKKASSLNPIDALRYE
ncbi:MAG: ABC transporter permease [Acidobacteriota bacterium]